MNTCVVEPRFQGKVRQILSLLSTDDASFLDPPPQINVNFSQRHFKATWGKIRSYLRERNGIYRKAGIVASKSQSQIKVAALGLSSTM